jgi:xanthine dehydrogenase accessory factor
MSGFMSPNKLGKNSNITYWEYVSSLLKDGQNVFLAMVVHHTIHSPGTTGAKLLVTKNRDMMGTIGGGIMEYTLVNRAQDVLKNDIFTSEIQILNHQKSGPGEKSGMICAGQQTNLYYLCQPEKDGKIVEEIVKVLKKGQLGTLSISSEGLAVHKKNTDGHEIQYSLTKNESNWHYQEQLKNFNRIAIMGGGHCSLALSRVMNNLGYDVFVFETKENISTLGLNKFATKVHIIDDFKEAVSRITLPHQTQVVIMTTDVASDVRVLLGILDKPFPFVGVMGSNAKISEITKQLKNEGISDKQLSRFTAPVGLPMVSNTPEEIAISVAAQLLQNRNNPAN